MSTHTPGPWKQLRDSHGRLFEIAAPCAEHKNCRKTIVFRFAHSTADGVCADGCHCEPNAHLIAAAPDLLKALKELLATLPDNWGDGVQDGVIRPMCLLADDVDDAFAAIAKAEGQ